MTRIANYIIRFIDIFYFPFLRRVVPKQTFRYAFCGAANVMLSWVLYYTFYHYLYCESNLDLELLVISPHIAAMITVFPINMAVGFILNKYVTFTLSPLRGRTQLIRYILSVSGSLALNYACMKIFVEALGIFPTPSQILATFVVTVYSYLMQKYFTFRGCENPE